ncbi:MAG: FAD-dependent oxidoreductase [Salinisphaera sp.]|nr:FAD-dependent oxidoreductase [Salinisphaera sp.]
MKATRVLLVVALLGLVAGYFLLDPGRYLGPGCAGQLLSLDCLHAQRQAVQGLWSSHPLILATGFFLFYVFITALSIPGAAILTLAGGAVFGFAWGVVIVSFASSVGATCAFLVARFLLRDWVRKRFGQRLVRIDQGVERDGAYYLFALRLVPVFPFFVINLVMGLTNMRARTFYLVSQLGMLAGTLVYVNAGVQLGQLRSLAGLLSPGLIGSFVLLGLFPLIAKKLLQSFEARKALRGWKKPSHFDRNLIVIGAGSAGLVTAYIAAAVKARVTLIEARRMGGDCLHTGCVPSKALLRTAKFLADVKRSREFGVHTAGAEFDFGEVMDRVKRVITTIAPHDSTERYESLGVECLHGHARVVDPWTVEIDGRRRLTARAIVLATGAEPLVPEIPGLEQVSFLTSDNLWALRELPERLVVLGGGPIGCELAQAFARLGARVTQVEMLDRILAVEDAELAEQLRQRLAADGVDIRVGHTARAVRSASGRHSLVCGHAQGEVEIEFDRLLVAVGRKARLQGFGLEELGVETERAIQVNEFLQTCVPSIYACGDAIAPYQFTHSAAHEAWFAAVNGLFGGFKRFRVDYSVMPWCTFTDPEVAHVGLNEDVARAQGIEYEVTRFDLAELDRAIAEEDALGTVKVLTAPGKDKILGAAIVGAHAGDLIATFVLAMKHGIGLNKLLATIHVYPTFAEAGKYAAGAWKRAHAPEKLLALLARFHAWRI